MKTTNLILAAIFAVSISSLGKELTPKEARNYIRQPYGTPTVKDWKYDGWIIQGDIFFYNRISYQAFYNRILFASFYGVFLFCVFKSSLIFCLISGLVDFDFISSTIFPVINYKPVGWNISIVGSRFSFVTLDLLSLFVFILIVFDWNQVKISKTHRYIFIAFFLISIFSAASLDIPYGSIGSGISFSLKGILISPYLAIEEQKTILLT